MKQLRCIQKNVGTNKYLVTEVQHTRVKRPQVERFKNKILWLAFEQPEILLAISNLFQVYMKYSATVTESWC